MTIPPEFSREIRLDTLGDKPHLVTLTADTGECAALADRFGLIAIDRLEAAVSCTRDGVAVAVSGRLKAKVTQSCVASGGPVPAAIDEAFTLRFLPEDQIEAGAEEIELSADDCDVSPYIGAAIDLGEAVAETLALALDPFPRSPDAESVLKAAGVLSEAEAGPFAALKGLREKLGKGEV